VDPPESRKARRLAWDAMLSEAHCVQLVEQMAAIRRAFCANENQLLEDLRGGGSLT
jgi:hypothetical protein